MVVIIKSGLENEDVVELALGDNVQNVIVDTSDNALLFQKSLLKKSDHNLKNITTQ